MKPMIDLYGIFSAAVKKIEMEGNTSLPKPVTIIAWEKFHTGCVKAHEHKGESLFREKIGEDGPRYARFLITQALVAYVAECP